MRPPLGRLRGCQVRARRFHVRRGDSGTAILEFVVLAVVLMIPLAYAVIAVMTLHAATYGAVTAAREAGRSYVTSDTTAQGAARARRAAAIAMQDQGFGEPTVKIECLGGSCLSPGSRVRIEISTRIEVPFVPSQAGTDRGTIPVTAVHEEVVDSYRATP